MFASCLKIASEIRYRTPGSSRVETRRPSTSPSGMRRRYRPDPPSELGPYWLRDTKPLSEIWYRPPGIAAADALTFGFDVQADRHHQDCSGRFPDLANRADVVGPPGHRRPGGFFMPKQKNGNDRRPAATRRIVIYDTTLRDGAQGAAVSFSAADKVRIARALDGLGFDYVEGGLPGSNPKDEELFAELAAH